MPKHLVLVSSEFTKHSIALILLVYLLVFRNQVWSNRELRRLFLSFKTVQCKLLDISVSPFRCFKNIYSSHGFYFTIGLALKRNIAACYRYYFSDKKCNKFHAQLNRLAIF